ncbi:MAG: VIT1/CCC1 transporter family protein [Alphaproteobacteria bacterium]
MAEHSEHHTAASATLRDLVIGMSDGLTVPFALAAGLSGAVASTRLIVTAGVAEIAAGAIAMALGGYLAAKTDAEHYAAERAREQQEIKDIPEEEAREVAGILKQYGLDDRGATMVVDGLRRNPGAWVDFMMRFELGLEEPDPRRLLHSPLTIGTAYIAGGLVPLTPYMLTGEISAALLWSASVTLIALLIFGGAKGHFSGAGIARSAVQTTLIGALAAAAAYALAGFLG